MLTRTPISSPGPPALTPATISRKESGAVLEAPAVPARAVDGREELVAEVAVAVLCTSTNAKPALRLPRSAADEVVDQTGDLVVGEQGTSRPQLEFGVEARGCR